MSFSYDLTTIQGQIRDLVGDNDSTAYLLSDETILNLYNTYGSLFSAASFALRSIANKKLLTGKNVVAGNYREFTHEHYKLLLDSANYFQELDLSTPADAQAEVIYTDFGLRELIRNKVLRHEPLDNPQ